MSLDLDKIITELQEGKHKAGPPVMDWKPENVGEIDIRIDNSGQWYHEGTAFKRIALVKLLSSILRLDDSEYFLVTPVEKLKIKVDDVPFVVKACHIPDLEEEPILLFTQTEETIVLDRWANWNLRKVHYANESIELPYIELRNNLFAKLDRNVFYQLVEHAIEKNITDEANNLLLISNGNQFPLGKLE